MEGASGRYDADQLQDGLPTNPNKVYSAARGITASVRRALTWYTFNVGVTFPCTVPAPTPIAAVTLT